MGQNCRAKLKQTTTEAFWAARCVSRTYRAAYLTKYFSVMVMWVRLAEGGALPLYYIYSVR